MKKLSTYYEDLVLDPKPNCFCMLKPGFVKYKDEFEKLLRAHSWKICKTCTKLFTRPEIEEFYICHKDKGFYNKLCDYMITEACQCYAVYKHIKNPVKDMESFKEKIRQEWGEDEMRNGMHSSDSDDNVKREIELAFNCVNERLVLSKDKHKIFPTSRKELEDAIAKEIDKNGNECSLNHIDVSKIDDLSYLFAGYKTDYGHNFSEFNGDISEWDVSNVNDMCGMFSKSVFNRDISKWDVRNVENVYDMFYKSKFNGNIDDWEFPEYTKNINRMFGKSLLNKKNNNLPIWYKKYENT